MENFSPWPRIRIVGDVGFLIEFGETISDDINSFVLSAFQSLLKNPVPGQTALTPAYASLLVGFDPIYFSPDIFERLKERMYKIQPLEKTSSRLFKIPVFYDDDTLVDIERVADQVGLDRETVIEQHLSGIYRVYMYGFAPGYAYLGGVPDKIQIPRRKAPVRGVPEGSVIIAGPQCIVTTVEMPTGWWVIGRSHFKIFRPKAKDPFLLRPGDRVTFVRQDKASYDRGVAS